YLYGLAFSAGIALGGLALAAVYEWRKTLLAPVFLHASLNALGMAILTAQIATSPQLGVYGEPHEGGCMITKVVPGSAADKAGVQVGDVVTNLDEYPVADIRAMSRVVRSKRVGDRIAVKLVRGGRSRRVEAVLMGLQE
ncbi:MAG TPA: PDZ domain-containing protein, partial [Isosphaeraceae bacterium]|nr:PDZ domain-containing protein [Isosphaeraceae bacterium]